MSKVILLDTETTGISNHPIHEHPQVIELAYLSFETLEEFKMYLQANKIGIKSYIEHIFEDEDWVHERYKPSMPIHIDATKIHGILLKDLVDKPRSETIKLPEETKYLIGHNIQFDYRCLGKPEGINLICTLKLIRAYCTFKKEKPPSRKLDDLIGYYFPEVSGLTPKLHNAKLDVIKVILILEMILNEFPKIDSWEMLWKFQEGL
jgi:exodeoxyribonuclease X